MEICSNGHVEIVHDERSCPMCELIIEIEALKDEIVSLRN